MSAPVVYCIMLTRNRPEMTGRAIRAFEAQTYQNALLMIWDTSDTASEEFQHSTKRASLVYVRARYDALRTIGSLRNDAVNLAKPAEILCTWDSDEWSSPKRLAEQVALLQSSGADLVGYRDMLFWRQKEKQAWLYSGQHAPVGTSFCYWRRVWEQHRFPDLPVPGNPLSPAEDTVWAHGLRVETVSSLAADGEPRMIAAIHEGNTQKHTEMACRGTGVCREFTRVPQWDEYCERNMAL